MAEYGYGTVAPGWEDAYYPHQNINNKTYQSFIDYDTNAEDWANWWGHDWIRCGVAGYTEGGGSDLTMSLAGLPDFKTEQASTAVSYTHLDVYKRQAYTTKISEHIAKRISAPRNLPITISKRLVGDVRSAWSVR